MKKQKCETCENSCEPLTGCGRFICEACVTLDHLEDCEACFNSIDPALVLLARRIVDEKLLALEEKLRIRKEKPEN